MFAVIFTFFSVVPGMSPPDISQLVRTAPVVITFGVLVLFPAMTSQIWGARLIPAPTAALLTMSEIVVATVSAYLLTGTELTQVSILGAGVILLSVVIDLRLKFNRRTL
jgi:drug/metabolite transporter (DMT)-like permease